MLFFFQVTMINEIYKLLNSYLVDSTWDFHPLLRDNSMTMYGITRPRRRVALQYGLWIRHQIPNS